MIYLKSIFSELKEETNLDSIEIAQIGAFGNPGRDPRGHTITVGYAAFLPSKSTSIKAGDDASDCQFSCLWLNPKSELAVYRSAGSIKVT